MKERTFKKIPDKKKKAEGISIQGNLFLQPGFASCWPLDRMQSKENFTLRSNSIILTIKIKYIPNFCNLKD